MEAVLLLGNQGRLLSSSSSSYHKLPPPTHFFTRKHILGGTHFVLFPTRRALNVSLLSLFFYAFSPNICEPVFAHQFQLLRYTDSNEGFTLLRPSSWVKVHKAGATVLFQEENDRTNNVGVVVNPVRLTTLRDFGTPHFVADKLIQAEKRKESTKDAAVIGVAERSGEGGLQVYEFEYMVDSTRGGMRRVFSAAFVASKKLYILNISHSDKPESPLDSQRRMMLQQWAEAIESLHDGGAGSDKSFGMKQRPDGDIEIDEIFWEQDFCIPTCQKCNGVLKPDVVFFGDNVPKDRATKAMEAARNCDAFLVLGSSVMTMSAFRLVRAAQEAGGATGIVNVG